MFLKCAMQWYQLTHLPVQTLFGILVMSLHMYLDNRQSPLLNMEGDPLLPTTETECHYKDIHEIGQSTYILVIVFVAFLVSFFLESTATTAD